MIAYSSTFTLTTRGKGTYEITSDISRFLAESELQCGTITVFVRHTSASLVTYENADPSAREDLHLFFERIAPENEPWFTHTLEGADDMPAHLKMALTRTSEVIPVHRGKLALGTWQGVFLFEHRSACHHREIVLTALGK